MSAVTVGEVRAQLAAVEGTLRDPDVLKNKVETAFKALDKDNSGTLETDEARQLVIDLCHLMHLPAPTDDEFKQHIAALDRDNDGALDVNEVGSGVVGALTFKAESLKHYLAFADRDKLPDTAPLPLQ